MAGPTLHDIASIASTAPISLAEQINASTRPAHSLLNRLIISRLKLAVPPHAEDPSLYGAGLLHVAPVYVTFEAIWDSLLGALPPPADSCAGTPESDFGGDHHTVEEPGASCLSMDSDTPISQRRHALTGRLHYALSNIHLAPLARSSRLRADIKYCLRLSDGDLDKQISLVTSSMPVAQIIDSVGHSIRAQPATLLAYAWVFYMALFSGGRYLRAKLQAAGCGFWRQEYDHDSSGHDASNSYYQDEGLDRRIHFAPVSPQRRIRQVGKDGLSFFNFAGALDGEDLKAEFKKRFAESEAHLTPGEKDDVVRESQRIFELLHKMVSHLDLLSANQCVT